MERVFKILMLGVFVVFLSNCAHYQKFNDWQQSKIYEWAYEDALDVVASAIHEKSLERCDFKFNAPVPPTTPVNSSREMKRKYGKAAKGLYIKKNLEVVYVKEGDYSSTLKHEYAHYLYDISNLSEYCKAQAFAYLVEYSAAQRLSVERWKRAYERASRSRRMR